MTRYRNYTIQYDPPPIPTRAHDYCYVHDEYGGPGDRRCGTTESAEACRRAIDEIEDDDDDVA